MQKESDDSIVYVPTMHREFFLRGFERLPLWPGLSRYWGQRNPDAWHKFFALYLRRQAAACLAELAQLDEAGIAAPDTAASSRSTTQKVSQERDDLSASLNGRMPRGRKRYGFNRRYASWAQRFLAGLASGRTGLRWSSSRRVIARGRRNWRLIWAHGVSTEPSDEDGTCFPA